MPAVGAVLPIALRPELGIIRRVQRLATDDAARSAMAAATRDERVGDVAWDLMFARELAHTVSWLVARAQANEPASPPSWPGNGRVLVLVPRHAHAVHVLRRAMPFALSRVPTAVAGHQHQTVTVTDTVAALRASIGLASELLTVRPEPATEQLRGAGEHDLVVLTGSVRSETEVRRSTRATVLAACGRCTVGLGSSRTDLELLAASLRDRRFPGSCTNWHDYYVGEWGRHSWLDRHGHDVDMVRLLAELRPTALYAPVRNLDETRSAPVRWCGYTVLPCTTDGTISTLVGFAGDPQGGWPGDFLA